MFYWKNIATRINYHCESIQFHLVIGIQIQSDKLKFVIIIIPIKYNFKILNIH